MLQDIDATIKAILDDPGAPEEVRNADVSFQTPHKDFTPTQSTINLFLFDVHENRDLRDYASGVDPPTADSPWLIGPPALRLNCTYLVTAWSKGTGEAQVRAEHDLLGRSLVWLSRFAVLDVASGFLQGELKNPPQRYPVPISVDQTKEDLRQANFWSALGIPPRASYSLTVTITAPIVAPTPQHEVHSVRLEMQSLIDPSLEGRVLTAKLEPVASATVRVLGADREIITGTSGEFSFDGLALGTHTLLVQMPDQDDVEQTVDYQPDSQVHNIVLPAE